MNQQTPEHMNMDSAQGRKAPEPVPHKLKQKLPKGEINPYTKTINPHEESVRKNTKHEPKDGKELEQQQLKGDFIRATSLLGSGPEKQELIAQKALEETTKVSEEELQKRDKQLFQTWIQQNPVQAALLGIDKDDPFEEKKGKSPAKYYKDSPLKAIYGQGGGVNQMSRSQAFSYGQQANQNQMVSAGIAGAKLLRDKLVAWDQERAEYKEKLKAQKDREAKELLEVSKPLVQTMDQSAALDESTKQLLAQQWKQGFVENEKKYKNGEIDQYEYALNKAQSLSNAQQYQSAVGNLTAKAQEFGQMLANGELSDATPEDARDFWTSVASGKGMNIAKTQDGKAVANNGLSIQNVNGQPTMVGWTAGQVEQARKAYEQLQQPDPVTGQPKITAANTSFEAFLGSVPRPGDPTYEQQKQDPLYANWIDGVNIPVANLASGEGLPDMLPKDDAFDANITQYADDIAQKAVNNMPYPQPATTEDLWNQASNYAGEYVNQMFKGMPEQSIRAIACDYLDMTPNDVRKVMDAEGGLDALKEQMKPEILQAIKMRFEADPGIAKVNQDHRKFEYDKALREISAGGRGGSRPKVEDPELLQRMSNQIDAGDFGAVAGQAGVEIEPIGHSMFSSKYWRNEEPSEYKVLIKGQKEEQTMTKEQLQDLLRNQLKIKQSHMNAGSQQQQQPQLNEAQSSEVDSIMADLGYGSPVQKRSPLKWDNELLKKALERNLKNADKKEAKKIQKALDRIAQGKFAGNYAFNSTWNDPDIVAAREEEAKAEAAEKAENDRLRREKYDSMLQDIPEKYRDQFMGYADEGITPEGAKDIINQSIEMDSWGSPGAYGGANEDMNVYVPGAQPSEAQQNLNQMYADQAQSGRDMQRDAMNRGYGSQKESNPYQYKSYSSSSRTSGKPTRQNRFGKTEYFDERTGQWYSDTASGGAQNREDRGNTSTAGRGYSYSVGNTRTNKFGKKEFYDDRTGKWYADSASGRAQQKDDIHSSGQSMRSKSKYSYND